jgi:SAM-dependent methyltransferase
MIPLLPWAGWTVIGTDFSADRLAAAKTHAGKLAEELVQADAHDLPFADERFDAVASILTHTDFDDVAAVFREVDHVLRLGGTFAYVGVNPCFASPSVERRDDGPAFLNPGYREAGLAIRLARSRELGSSAHASGSTTSRWPRCSTAPSGAASLWRIVTCPRRSVTFVRLSILDL